MVVNERDGYLYLRKSSLTGRRVSVVVYMYRCIMYFFIGLLRARSCALSCVFGIPGTRRDAMQVDLNGLSPTRELPAKA